MSAEPEVYHALRAAKVAIDRSARDQYVDQVKGTSKNSHSD